jgi:hypothetical protein
MYQTFLGFGFDTAIQTKKIDFSTRKSIYVFPALTTLLRLDPYQLPKRYIIYNWEQLTVDGALSGMEEDRAYNESQHPNYIKGVQLFKGAMEVWDYSPKNVEYLSSLGVQNARVVLHGYSELFSFSAMNSSENVVKNINLHIWLAINNRRRKYIEMLTRLYPANSSKILFGGNFPSIHAKATLNVHYYGGKSILEIHRIMQCVALKVLCLKLLDFFFFFFLIIYIIVMIKRS